MQKDAIQRVEGGRRFRGDVRNKKPLISIITVVFQDKGELKNILNNVFEFDTSEFELIVIDGGSRDGTVELLRQWDEKIDYWLSEQDAGIYDAMNKGISAARGEYILHLNAGDRLIYLPVQELKSAFMEQIDVAAFRVSIHGEREFIPSSGRLLRFRNTLHHQGTFYRSGISPQYDLRYKVLADFDLNQRLALRGAKIKSFANIVALHAAGGISGSRLAHSENLRIASKNHGWAYWVGAWVLSKGSSCKIRLRRIAQARRHMFTGC